MTGLKRIIEKSRYMVLVAVLSSLLAAAAAFGLGVAKTAAVVVEVILYRGSNALTVVRLIEVMDKFLIAVGLYIFAAGLYELFFEELDLPEWLAVRSLNGLKARLSSIIILVMGITFLERMVAYRDGTSLLYLAISVTLVAGVLIVFAYIHERH
jgi:uncharacterized membrane protein YqhA